MKFNFLFKTVVVGFIIIIIASCDKDVNEIGAGILGENHYGLDSTYSKVIAYNKNNGAVQTNDLPLNSLGYYNNPVFGKTKASFITQLQLITSNPKFYDPANVIVDSVYLYIPYFSSIQSTDATTNNSIYKLDSINGESKIKLKIYESGYYLRDFDDNPIFGFGEPQKYYSNQKNDFESNGVMGTLLNDDNKNIFDATTDFSQNDEFVFSDKQIKFYKNNADGTPGNPATATVRERLAPGLMVNLNKTFFKNKIVQAPSGVLYNNNVFENYFRGLYFQVDNAATSPNQGTLAKMNFSQGYIMMVYHDKTSETVPAVIRKTLQIKLGGHSVNLLENQVLNPISSPNTALGDSKLYLQGGPGSMAIIDLFGGLPNNSSNAELQNIKDQNLLINEANLTFYIDKDAMGTDAPEPNRIYLYDLTNKRPLIDFYSDLTTSNKSKYSKYIHGGIIKKVNLRGSTYKIKITNHIRNLVINDSTNVKLGLVITENINNPLNSYLLTPNTIGTFQTKLVPVMSVVNQLGTIIHGSNPSVPFNNRVKLEIFYTKPN
jgi:hypothetical protein